MALKEYAAVNPQTNLVVLITQCEETEVGTLFPNYTMVELDTPAGYRKPLPGMLYFSQQFWVPISAGVPGATGYTKITFRRLFTETELVKIDNFTLDPGLTTDQKNLLNTLTINLYGSLVINLTAKETIEWLDQLVAINYLTEERKLQVLAGETRSNG